METRTFGRTGLEVSVLGFGGAPIGVLETGEAEVDGVLGLLLDHGVNLVDTAAGYRGSEEAIGRSIGSRRDDFVLVSKCGQAFDDLPGEPWSEELITATIERSLERLQTDHLDVMLLHTCDLEVLERGEAVGALVRAREAGKIRFAGYSGDNQAGAYAARLEDVAVIQTSINICDQVNIDQVLPVADADYARYAETYTERLALMAIGPQDMGFEESDWPELALRFTLSCDIGTAIIGTTNPDHVRANIEAASRGALPEEAVAQLREAFVEAMADADDEWTGQT